MTKETAILGIKKAKQDIEEIERIHKFRTKAGFPPSTKEVILLKSVKIRLAELEDDV